MKLLTCFTACLLSIAAYGQHSVHTLKNNGQPIPGLAFAELKSKTVFFADDNIYGMELWETDGETSKMVADVNPNGDACDAYPFYPGIFNLNSKAYFAATDGQHGIELWEYDGANPPKMVADIASGADDSQPEYFASVNNKLYFVARPAYLWNIYCYDPANGTTSNVTNFTSNTFAEKLTVVNGKLVFVAYMDAQVEHELYVLDPQNNSINLVANIDATPGASSNPGSLIAYNNKLYFFASEPATGDELYEYDGVNAPVRLTDINPGSAGSVINITIPNLCAYKGELYFGMQTSGSTSELYRYNPATHVASAVTQFNNKVVSGEMIVYGRRLFFGAKQGSGFHEMYVYDGASPAQPVSAFGVQNLEAFENLSVSNGRLFFGGLLAPAHEGNSFMFVDSAALEVPDVIAGSTMIVYPNPAATEATISFTLKQAANLNVQLADMQGRVVYTTERQQYNVGSQQIKMPVQELATGIYIYTVMNEAGEILAKGQLVKK